MILVVKSVLEIATRHQSELVLSTTTTVLVLSHRLGSIACVIRFLNRAAARYLATKHVEQIVRIVDPAETYRRRAERAERACEEARTPEAKRLARTAAQRWRELAEVAERREAEGPPIPVRFGDVDEAVQYAQNHKFALYWKGTHAFAKRQRELGERFVSRPVFTRKGSTYVGLVPLDKQKKAGGKRR